MLPTTRRPDPSAISTIDHKVSTGITEAKAPLGSWSKWILRATNAKLSQGSLPVPGKSLNEGVKFYQQFVLARGEGARQPGFAGGPGRVGIAGL